MTSLYPVSWEGDYVLSSLSPWPAPVCVLNTEISLTKTSREACKEASFQYISAGLRKTEGEGIEIFLNPGLLGYLCSFCLPWTLMGMAED